MQIGILVAQLLLRVKDCILLLQLLLCIDSCGKVFSSFLFLCGLSFKIPSFYLLLIHAYEDLFKQVVQLRRLFSAVLRFLTLNFLQYLLNSLERLPVDFSDVLFFVLKEKIASVSVEPDIAENLRRQ